MQEQAASSVAASLPSTSEISSTSALQLQLKQGTESDDEIRRVPEIGDSRDGSSRAGLDRVQGRKRGRSPADKEHKRLKSDLWIKSVGGCVILGWKKRLLRNRVSAQQARERKKAYMNELELRVKDLEKNNSQLEEILSTLQNENQMLRHILKNTTTTGIQEARKQ